MHKSAIKNKLNSRALLKFKYCSRACLCNSLWIRIKLNTF